MSPRNAQIPGADLYIRSFGKIPTNLSATLPQPDKDVLNIAVGHTLFAHADIGVWDVSMQTRRYGLVGASPFDTCVHPFYQVEN